MLVVAGALLVGSGLVLTGTGSRADAPDFGTPVAATTSPSTHPTGPPAAPPPAPLPAPDPAVPAAPAAVTLPAVADAVPLVPVGVLPGGGLALPERPTVLGWYAAGAVPGSPAGTAVLAGHIDSAVYGAGPLEGLLELAMGDPVTVTDEAGRTHAYVVSARTSQPKSALPPELFRTDGPPQLALVTCGGEFDERTGSYADNVVVLAVPAPGG
ncbi:class F sortase [Blastococcus sp. TF02A-26]|nr:class F sortase [Blastococcus sp. TF02A-26]